MSSPWGGVGAQSAPSWASETGACAVPYYVLFFIDLKTRVATIAGVTTSPDDSFIAQMARNLTDSVSGFLRGHRVLICDRDTKYTTQFRNKLEALGVRVVFTPALAPNRNAYAERFVLSIKSECLNRMIFFSESSVRKAARSYVAHYHCERAHQGLGNERIHLTTASSSGLVECMERLDSLPKHNRRAA